jgi:RND family efflux transporter MFP subunit
MLLATGRLHGSEATEVAVAAPRVVMVTTVRFEPGRRVQHLPGWIAARTETDLAFRVGGKLLARSVSVGDEVRAGDVVATLDETDLRLQLEAAEAERTAARIALEKAEINLRRVTELEAKGWTSDQASDREAVIAEEARARLLRAERNVELAENQLSYATLRADADGVVTDTMAEAGQVLAAGAPVVRIARAGGREAVVAIPEAMLAEVRGAEATVELWSEPGRPIPATLRELSPVADGATRTFEARYALARPRDAALGMSATVSLASRGEAAAELPAPALFDTGAGPVVWVVGQDGRLEARHVTVAGYAAGAARIIEGLADGERVVTLGAHKLEPGEAVRPVEAEG